MLGKLFKHEIKATGRIFLPTYLVLLIFAILTRVFIVIGNLNLNTSIALITSTGMILSIIMYVLTILGAYVVTYIIIMQRFYKNLTGDEGYLMFTLPVNTWELVGAKLLSGLTWMLTTTLVVVSSVIIVLMEYSEYIFEILKPMLQLWATIQRGFYIDIGLPVFMMELVLTMLFATLYGILLIYAAIAIGHTFQKHRIWGAVGAYIGLYMLIQVITSICGLPLLIAAENGSLSGGVLVYISFLSDILINFGLTVALFFVTTYILNKQLNLE